MIRRPPRSTLFPYNDALPIYLHVEARAGEAALEASVGPRGPHGQHPCRPQSAVACAQAVLARSEEHTSELQSRLHLVCRLLLEKKKKKKKKSKKKKKT